MVCLLRQVCERIVAIATTSNSLPAPQRSATLPEYERQAEIVLDDIEGALRP